MTSYGRAYDHRDVVSKTKTRNSNTISARDVRVGNVLELRRAHVVDYRRHERAGGQLQL
jgi:hypothetical protein